LLLPQIVRSAQPLPRRQSIFVSVATATGFSSCNATVGFPATRFGVAVDAGGLCLDGSDGAGRTAGTRGTSGAMTSSAGSSIAFGTSFVAEMAFGGVAALTSSAGFFSPGPDMGCIWRLRSGRGSGDNGRPSFGSTPRGGENAISVAVAARATSPIIAAGPSTIRRARPTRCSVSGRIRP